MKGKELAKEFNTWCYEKGDDEDYGTVLESVCHGYLITEIEEEVASKFGKFKFVTCNDRSATGDHDEVQTVIHFIDHDVYLAAEGYYSSHSGSNYEDAEWKQVYPHTITRVIYTTTKP